LGKVPDMPDMGDADTKVNMTQHAQSSRGPQSIFRRFDQLSFPVKRLKDGRYDIIGGVKKCFAFYLI
jgi:hypothetical protein